ncbi:MAG: Ig-like domain-containing protein [Candidatus Ozemobacteraceae bacterium]
MSFIVCFSKPVIITGTAAILLETGNADRLATSTGENYGSQWVFQYQVQPGDISNALDYVSVNALSGDIHDYSSSPFDLKLPVPGTENSLSYSGMCVIDTKAPVLDSANSLSPKPNTIGFDPKFPLNLTFNEVVQKAGSGSISIFRADNSLLECIPVNSSKLEVYSNLPVCRVFPTTAFASGSTYKVCLEGPLVKDMAGNEFQGRVEPSSWLFTAGEMVSSLYSFRIDNVFPVPFGKINQENHEITIDIPYGTSLSNLVPVFDFTGKSVSPSPGVACDFSTGSFTFTLTASDGSTIDYRAFISTPKSVVPSNVWLDSKAGMLYNTSSAMEYSLNSSDGRDGIWVECKRSFESVSVSVGNNIWVREKADPNNKSFLGKVNAISGPDYAFGGNAVISVGPVEDGIDYNLSLANVTSGEKQQIRLALDNLAAPGTGAATVSFFLSSDQVLGSDDRSIATISFDASLVGRIPVTGYLKTDFVIPDILGGSYFMIAAIDHLNEVQEQTKGNNCTRPVQAFPFLILDNTPRKNTGACRFVNSMGKGGWEKIPDGRFWMTYEALKKYQIPVNYFFNTFNGVYKPVVIALFQPCHPLRSQCRITFGLGDPKAPQAVKIFGVPSKMGELPFPGHLLALDISEFSPRINDFDLFLKVENSSEKEGALASFSVEFTRDGGTTAFKTVDGENGRFDAASETVFIARTKDALTPEEISVALSLRNSLQSVSIVEETPDSTELSADMKSIGVYNPGQDYDRVFKGKYHSGYRPPTLEEWQGMKKLRSLQFPQNVRANQLGSVNSLDHSKSIFFPPIGDQSTKPTCVAFATTYYMHTFNEAKEHNWDLSNAKWVYPDPFTSDAAGGPDSCRDKIFSPDFVYNLINRGTQGSWPPHAVDVLSGIGCCSWEKMPYSLERLNCWGNLEAWREAAKYRRREIAPIVGGRTSGYFVMRTDTDIELLKSILKAGYIVTASIDGSLFEALSDKDVLNAIPWDFYATGHSVTIVGFKEGDAWDPDNPDQ